MFILCAHPQRGESVDVDDILSGTKAVYTSATALRFGAFQSAHHTTKLFMSSYPHPFDGKTLAPSRDLLLRLPQVAPCCRIARAFLVARLDAVRVSLLCDNIC